MFANILMAAAVGISGASQTSNKSVPAEVSSKIALYLLVSTACDEMTGTHTEPSAKRTSETILQGYGYSSAEIESMLTGFVRANLHAYVTAVKDAGDNRDAAIRYFCSSTIDQKKKLVEEITAHGQP